MIKTSPTSNSSKPQATVAEIDPATLSKWLAAGACQLVDVREPDENARERIATSQLRPTSRLTFDNLDPSKPIVFHCLGGKRSLDAATRAAAHFGTQVYSLAGGINAWKSANLPTITGKGPRLSVLRQTQLVIGLVNLTATILAALVSPWWLIITGFLGTGLTIAGATGFCGLANLLALMPWNKASASTTCNLPT